MSFIAALRVSLAALLVNKGRSILTSLGIVIGISAVIAMVSAGSGARHKLDDRLDSVGKNMILIRAGARTGEGAIADYTPLKMEDAAALRQQLHVLLLGVAETQTSQKQVTSRTSSCDTAIVGSTPDLQKIRNWKMEYGRFYNQADVAKDAPVCMLGKTVAQKLFPKTPNPVGQNIRVQGMELTVIGVLAEKGRSLTGGDQDDHVSMPITTMQKRLMGNTSFIPMILSAAAMDDDLEKAKTEITRVLRKVHRLKPNARDDFDVSSVRELSELAFILTTTMQVLITIIASISLVVGGIGIMNIMLVSVTERTREIGIRMAVGATPHDVLTQFLMEAIVLALIGGLIGITLGIVGAYALSYVGSWPIVVSPGSVALAFAVSAGVGVFFGYYPAWKASRLDPIEALRYE
jgi:putative ABC transport system permease protein